MKLKVSYLLAVALACVTLIFISCQRRTISIDSQGKHRHGPPPHAPAHGYRHKYQDVELVYDSGRGVYVVVDFPDHFYFKGHYYRFYEPHWQVSVHIEGPWEFVSERELPPGLRGKGKGKAKGKSEEHPGRGRGLQRDKE